MPCPGAGPVWQGSPAWGLLLCRGARAPWAGLGSKAPIPPQEQGCPHSQVWPGSAITGHRILAPPCSRAHPATQISISWPDSPPQPLIHTGPNPEHAGHPFPSPPAETPTQPPALGAWPFAVRARAGSLCRDLAARHAVSAERALGSALPPTRRAWALVRHHCALIRAAGTGLSLGEVRVALLCNLLPHGLAPAALPGSHPSAGVRGVWRRFGEMSWLCGAVLRPLPAVNS